METPFEPSAEPLEEGVAGDGEAAGTSVETDEADGEGEGELPPPTTTGTDALGLDEAEELAALELPAPELAEGAGPPAAADDAEDEANPPAATDEAAAEDETAADEAAALEADDKEAAADDAAALEAEALDELATEDDLLAAAEVTAALVDVGTGVTGLPVVVVAALVLVTGAAEVQGLLHPLEYLEVVLGPLPTVLAPNLLTSEETCRQFIPGGGWRPYSAMYQSLT